MSSSTARSVQLTSLPPELLENIFRYLSSDIVCIRNLANVCTRFQTIICSVPVRVQIPLAEDDLAWLVRYNIPVRHIINTEIAAYVGDQILSLNLSSCRVARLVGYDYLSRRCEVTPHYLAVLHYLRQKARTSLRRLELNVDLSRGRRYFKFAELIVSFQGLRSLSVHFSAHIELNQRILNNDDAQNFINMLLANLPNLSTFHIFICPPRRLRVASKTLTELGIYKTDSVEVVSLSLPILERLSLHESTADLFRKIMSDRETGSHTMHRNLLAVVYDGCPNLRIFNNLRLPPSLCPPHRLEKKEWTRQLNRALVRQYKHQALRQQPVV